jgi:hypothetical protein
MIHTTLHFLRILAVDTNINDLPLQKFSMSTVVVNSRQMQFDESDWLLRMSDLFQLVLKLVCNPEKCREIHL